MNVAIITGLYATDDFPSGGAFINERLKELRKTEIPFHVYAISRRYSLGMKLVYKYLLKSDLKNRTVVPWDSNSDFSVIYDTVNVPLFIISLIIPNLYWKLKRKSLLRRIFVTHDTVIHAHWAYPHGFFAIELAQELNLKSVITCHGSDIHSAPKISPLLRKVTVNTIQSSDKTIFVSHALLSSAIEMGYDGINSTVIPNGVDINRFFPVEKSIALEKTGWTQSRRHVVGFVGNLIPIKRADKFVEIFTRIQQQVGDVEFILVGDGELAENIRVACQNAGLLVTFTGRISHDDICYWMNLFDVMILPSRNEGWPCVVLEAYACGTPVVGADNGGVAEAMGGLCPSIEDGDGFEERFADAVSKILIDKFPINSKQLITHARELTWRKCVEKEIKIYNQ